MLSTRYIITMMNLICIRHEHCDLFNRVLVVNVKKCIFHDDILKAKWLEEVSLWIQEWMRHYLESILIHKRRLSSCNLCQWKYENTYSKLFAFHLHLELFRKETLSWDCQSSFFWRNSFFHLLLLIPWHVPFGRCKICFALSWINHAPTGLIIPWKINLLFSIGNQTILVKKSCW